MQHAIERLPLLRDAVSRNAPGAESLVSELKVAMTSFPSFASASSSPSTEETALSRAILQLALILYVKRSDMRSFERTFSQLRPFYASRNAESAEAAAERRLAIGLDLMHLLVEARLAEFHSDVELLVRGEDDRASPAVAFPLALEAYLMEGSYNKILAARNVMPSPEFFGPLVERLTLTVRDDIAECAAASFSALSLAAAQKLFMFDNATDFLTFARSKSTWSLSDRGISFATVAKNAAVELPVAALVENTLSYATDIERIV